MMMGDAAPVRPFVPLRSDPARPLCPQFRPAHPARAYPVHGYCALASVPGGLMVPSTEEYQGACTTPHFASCPWFRDPQASWEPAVHRLPPPDVWVEPALPGRVAD